MRWLLFFCLALLPLGVRAGDLTPDEQARKAAMAQCLDRDKRWGMEDSWNEQPSSGCQRIGFNECLLQEHGSNAERSTHCAAAEAKLWMLIVEDVYAEVLKRAICRDVERNAHGWEGADALPSLQAAHETWLAHGTDDCSYIAELAGNGPWAADAAYCLRDHASSRAALYKTWLLDMEACS